ncbi:hypothetical protein AAVH_12287 [Aphelenchoides avenae]|nr:hypothetical protein AAVH_12287 [Aphelenchus avenae]
MKPSLPDKTVCANRPPVTDDRLCCYSVFVWAKVLAVLSAVTTARLMVPAAIRATEGNYLWLGAAVPAALLSTIMLLNVFYWHRWIVYAVFTAWLSIGCALLGLITVLVVLAFGSQVAFKCYNRPSCPVDLKYGFATSSVLIAALALAIFAFVVFSKAARCQTLLDGPSVWSTRETLIKWTEAGVITVNTIILALFVAALFGGYGIPRA